MGIKHEVTNTGLVKFRKQGTQELVLEQGITNPGTALQGQVFYRTDFKELLAHDGTDFKAIGGGSHRVYGEKVNELPNGLIVDFTVDNPFITDSTEVTVDGVRQERGVDYIESPANQRITFTVAPTTGQIILVSYSQIEGTSLPFVAKASAIATPGQTVFTLPFAYRPDSNSLFVYSSGLLQIVGPTEDYQETNTTQITFNSPRTGGEVLQFTKWGVANDQSTTGWIDLGAILYTSTLGTNVGIGTASPTSKLQVKGDTNITDSSDVSIMLIDTTNKRLGIGITTPTDTIHLHDTTSDSPRIHFTNTATGSTSGDGFFIGFETDLSARFVNRESAPIKFYSNNIESVRLDSTQLTFVPVMYGVFSTDQTGFEINNVAHHFLLRSNTTEVARFTAENVPGVPQVFFNSTSNNATNPNLTFLGDGDTGLFYPGANQVAFTAGGSERLRITTTGVGIGLTPANEILELSGALLLGNAVGTADGTIRYTGADFEGRKSGSWVSLTASAATALNDLTDVTITSPLADQNIAFNGSQWINVAGTGADGWTSANETWTYASATSFTIAGVDVTSKYRFGTKIKCTNSTVKYFYVVSSSFSTDTTVTVTGGADFSLTNVAITANFLSYISNPVGFPSIFTLTPSTSGFSTLNTNYAAFSLQGRQCTFLFLLSGTSDSTSFTTTVPFAIAAASSSRIEPTAVKDNSVFLETGWMTLVTGTTLNFYTSINLAGWTASGVKYAQGQISYAV